MKAGNRQTIGMNLLLKSNHFYCWKIITNEKKCTSGELVVWSLPQKLDPHQAASSERELTSSLMLHTGTKLKLTLKKHLKKRKKRAVLFYCLALW